MGTTVRDITGVPTAELAAVYGKYADCDYETMAERTGIDINRLKDIVFAQDSPFTGLNLADKIVTLGLGLCLNTLTAEPDPELHIVVAQGRGSARAYVVECYEAKGLPAPRGKDMDRLIDSHLARRAELVQLSPAQMERREQERERARQAAARKRNEAA